MRKGREANRHKSYAASSEGQEANHHKFYVVGEKGTRSQSQPPQQKIRDRWWLERATIEWESIGKKSQLPKSEGEKDDVTELIGVRPTLTIARAR